MRDPLRDVKVLRDELSRGGCAIGSLVTLADPLVIEIFGAVGFDFLVVDAEHSAQPSLGIRTMLQAAGGSSVVVIVRPRTLDPALIAHYLDLGAGGILAPFVETADDAARLVAACRYPRQGQRGFGPRRASSFGLRTDQYMADANDAILCLGIIESVRGAEHADSIVSQEGLDGVVIGPMDLTLDLGILGELEHPRYLEAVAAIQAACKRHDKLLGIGCSGLEHAVESKTKGYSLLIATADDNALRDGAAQVVSALR